MSIRAFLDSEMLFAATVDHDRLYRNFVPFLDEVRERGTEVWIEDDWLQAYAVPGGLLDFGVVAPIKELRDYLNSTLPRLRTGSNVRCTCCGDLDMGLGLNYQNQGPSNISCGTKVKSIYFASDAVQFQGFWRRVLEEEVTTAPAFDKFLGVAFWSLEFGPESLGKWDKCGHKFVDIRS